MACANPESPATDEFPGAAGVVHDLGNLIQIAASAVNIISRSSRACPDSALEPVLARARTALERASALVRQTNVRTDPAFAVRPTQELQSVTSCVDEIRALISSICEPDISLSIDVPADLPPVRCHRIELQSAVLNLVTNARGAMPDGGSIVIVARGVADDQLVELSVADNGVGMSRETLLRAFNPYFTTRADGRGTGLGLAMVQRFAQEAGGRVELASTPGAGTTVTLRLPSAR
jgi:signal transduction histidine kinase